MRSILNRILDALSGPSTLFGRLYGYWEPPEGWERTTSTAQQVNFEHAELGTLQLTQEPGLDNTPVYVLWIVGEPALSDTKLLEAQRDQLMTEFLPGSDWVAGVHRVGIDVTGAGKPVYWEMRRKTWNEILGG